MWSESKESLLGLSGLAGQQGQGSQEPEVPKQSEQSCHLCLGNQGPERRGHWYLQKTKLKSQNWVFRSSWL